MKTTRKLLLALALLLVSLCVLAMASCNKECSHTWGEWTVTEEPSCTEAGTRTRTCSECETSETESVAALSHSFSKYVSDDNGTCLANGTETAVCDRCTATGTREAANSKNAEKHASDEVCYRKNASDSDKHDTCYVCCGALIETQAHTWNDGELDGTVTVYTCTGCAETKRVPLPDHKHEATFVAAKGATCSASGNVAYWYCESCDTYFADEALTEQLEESETLVEKTVHAWDDGETDGTVMVYTCTGCGETKRVPLPDHEHAAAFVEEKAASCTESGNVAYWYCESCDGYFADEALTVSLTEADTVIAPTHTSTEFNYTVNAADGSLHDKCYTCCGTVAETVAHTYEFHQNLMVSCEQGGGEEYLCVCGETKIENETPAAGHSVEFWDLVDETEKPDADCTYVQEWQGTCISCVTLQSKTNTVVRHQFVATIETHPTCQSGGSKTYACHCGAVPEVATVAIPATPAAHAWDDGVTEGGITTYACQTEGCNETKTALVYANTTQTVSATDLADNELVLDGVALRLDDDTLSLLGDASAVTVSAAPVSDRDSLIASLPEILRGQITDATPIYDFSLSAGGVAITEFEGGIITITLPYTLPDGTDADCVSVWYVTDDGEVAFYEATYVAVGDDGYLTFEATHFSSYLPAPAPESDACELYGHNDIQTVVAPTCTAYGYTEYHCQRCGSSRVDNTKIPLGHAYDGGTSTPATCSVPGKTTYACTREDCEHRLSTALYAPHSYEYNEEESCPATCTEDGYIIRTCTTCGATQREEQQAPGQHDIQSVSVALATGATSCTDGVVFTKKCWACGHTESETVYEHTPYDKYTDNEGNYLIPGETAIGLGSYLAEAGIQYSEEPRIIFEDGCLCGEQKSRIYMTNGMGQYGNELFTGWFEGFSWHSIPQNPSDCQTVVLQTQSETVWAPALGMPVESPVFKVQFKQILEIDGCHYTYSVEVKIGYDEGTGNALRTEIYVLSEYDWHDIKKTATVADPTKSCFENCYDENHSFYYGITVTETCDKCGEVLNTYTDAVSNDSQHYWYNAETYDYKDEDCRDGYYGVRVFIKKCPCGKSDYTLHTGDCSFTGQYVGDVKVYTCTSCGYIYAEKTVETDSVEDCHRSKIKYLWLGCESITDFESCEKTYVCVLIDEDVHYGQRQERESVQTDYPCYYHITLKTVCPTCFAVIRSSSYYGTEHDTTEATTTDSHGNVTTTESCSVDGCGYVHITVTDKDGHVLREYTVDKDYQKGEKTVELLTYKMIWGSIRPMMERYEYYDLESGALLRWNETTYHYESDPDKGCFSTTVSINHKGELSQGGGDCLCCFDQTEEQMRTCLQDGYYREICSQCGHVEETWYEPARHEWSTEWMPVSPDGHTVEYHRCMMCGVCTKDAYGEGTVDVMPSYDASDDMTVLYRKPEGSSATGIDATYGFVAYATDEYGQLIMDADTNEPMAITLSGVNVTDDGEGSLSFSMTDAKMALENESLNEQYMYTVCFVVHTSCGAGVIPIS